MSIKKLIRLLIHCINYRISYICKECGKTFFEKYPFLSKYARTTTSFYKYLFKKLTTNTTNKAIAEELSCSPTTVARIIQPITISKPMKLPRYLGIDEFKGNTDGEKYQLILTDLENNKIFDILPSRKKEYIKEYFKGFKNRNEVEYFVMDMTGNYKDIAWLFPNAKVIVDKFHYVRQVYWALDNVRKRIQKQFIKEKRIYFKHSKKLLYKDYDMQSRKANRFAEYARGFYIRTELSKSRQFYNDTFKTSVNYEDLMNIKKELLK